MPTSEDGKSRRRIMDLLKQSAPLSAAALADHLGVSAMAVRQHLYDLQSKDMVDFEEVPQKKGRPQKQWRLTPAANRYFPDAHSDLALDLIEAVQNAFGADGLQKLVETRTGQQRERYATRLGKRTSLPAKLRKLAEIRSEEGYMAAVTKTNGKGTNNQEPAAWMLLENHCPICDAAKACTGLCASELQLFQDVLGNDVAVERVEHILSGARRCAYKITPKR